MTIRRAASAAAVALALAALTGCNRQPPKFVPPGADSTGAMAADSFAIYVGEALERWEANASDAGPFTARLLVDDLRRHPDRRLADRARTFLDSCGFSGEVAGGVDVAAVNFFSRSDPTGGSWPYIVWRDQGVVKSQSIEGSGMRLLDLSVRPGAGGDQGEAAKEPQQVAAIFARSSNRGQQPVVVLWRRLPTATRWSMAQTLGPDSLGGTGVVEFVSLSGGGTGLEARTYRSTPGFDECPTCPHVHRTHSFAWTATGFQRTGDEVAPSPYYAFVRLIAALSVNDRELAMDMLSDESLYDAAVRYEWGSPKGAWRVAPGTDDSASEMTFFRGRREAYKVRFAAREGRWMVTDIQPTQRTVE